MKSKNLLAKTVVAKSGIEYEIYSIVDAIYSNTMLLDLFCTFLNLCNNDSINKDPNSKDANELFDLYNSLRLATNIALMTLDDKDKKRH